MPSAGGNTIETLVVLSVLVVCVRVLVHVCVRVCVVFVVRRHLLVVRGNLQRLLGFHLVGVLLLLLRSLWDTLEYFNLKVYLKM